jgi:hypothetical protein
MAATRDAGHASVTIANVHAVARVEPHASPSSCCACMSDS